MAALLARLLAKKPEDRYLDAETALVAVREARNAPPVTPDAPRVAEVVPPVHPTVPVLEVSPLERPAPQLHAPATTRSGVRWPAMRAPLLGGSAAVLLVVLAAALWPGDDPPNLAPPDAPVAVAQRPFGTPTRASAQALEAVDASLRVGKRSAARTLLAELRAAFPTDPEVLWRAALAEGDPNRASEARAALLLEAIALGERRLEDPQAQAVVVQELERPTVPDPLLDLVIEHGEPIRGAWTQALLGRERDALPYAQRQRLIAVLRVDPRSVGDWDPAAQRCLDLWQAADTPAPCETFAKTLAKMQANPSATYTRTLEAVSLPAPGDAEAPDACEGLAATRDAALEAIGDAKGDPRFLPADHHDQAEQAEQARGSGREKKRRPFRRIRRAFGG